MRLEVFDATDGRSRSEAVALALSPLDDSPPDLASPASPAVARVPARAEVTQPRTPSPASAPATAQAPSTAQAPLAQWNVASGRSLDSTPERPAFTPVGANRTNIRPEQTATVIPPAAPVAAPPKQGPAPLPDVPAIALPPASARANQVDLHLPIPESRPVPPPSAPQPEQATADRAQPSAPVEIKSATPIHRAYPKLDKERILQQSVSVRVEVQVDERGTVTNARLASGPVNLSPSSLAAAKQWQYTPATIRGVPVKSTAVIEFVFHQR